MAAAKWLCQRRYGLGVARTHDLRASAIFALLLLRFIGLEIDLFVRRITVLLTDLSTRDHTMPTRLWASLAGAWCCHSVPSWLSYIILHHLASPYLCHFQLALLILSLLH